MRRKPGTLLPIERSILGAALALSARGSPAFHGFSIAKLIQDREGARQLTAHGTLYRALDRLYRAGLLESEWEDPNLAAQEGRPRRRFYRIAAAGEAALARAGDEAPESASRREGYAAS